MAKFILIDPSIQDYQGHYFEYALRVLRAAEERGFVPVVAGNRRLQNATLPVRVRAVYRFGFWYSSTATGSPRPAKSWQSTLRSIWLAPLLRMQYSWLGRWLALNGSWQAHLERQAWRKKIDAGLGLKLFAAFFTNTVRMTLLFLTCWLPFRAVITRGLRLLASYSARVRCELASHLVDVVIQIKNGIGPRGALPQWLWQRVKLRQFIKDTLALLKLEPVLAGDMAMLSVTSPVELTALARLFSAHPDCLRGTWHLVFRHNLYLADVEHPYGETTRSFRNALHEFRRSMPSDRVFLYADTEELAAQYNLLGVLPFRTLPVPVGRAYFRDRKSAPPAAPIRIAYLGDARREKGYQLLPRLVGDLWPDYVSTDRAEFLIQSNFNCAAGSPETIVARAQLLGWAGDRVRLITEPPSPDAYRAHVQSADVILLPYDAKQYYVRSSGILAEALAAGVPVVVPAGTWMSMQLTKPHFEYHESLRQNVPMLESRRAEDLSWGPGISTSPRQLKDRALVLTQRRRHVCRTSIPAGATDLLITFRQQAELRGQFVRVQVTQRGPANRRLRRNMRVVGGDSSECSTLIRLHRGARSIRLTIRDAYSSLSMKLHDLRLDFLSAKERLPQGAVGVILNRPTGLTCATIELLRHHAHYRATALQHAEAWSKRHCPERLVQELLSTAAGAAGQDAYDKQSPPSPHFTLGKADVKTWARQ